MTIKRFLAVTVTLCLTVSTLCGCAGEKPADTTETAQSSENVETIYLLTIQDNKNEQGEVVMRTTYTYDDRGLLLKKEMDANGGSAEWNDELGCYEYQVLPCDGVVDIQTEFAYDEYGNPTKFDGTSYEYTYDNKGKITSFSEISPELILDYTVEYDAAGNLKVFRSQRDAGEAPMLRYEIKYDNTGFITQMTTYDLEWMISYRLEYDAVGRLASLERITEDPIMSESFQFTYDEMGRVVKETDSSYQYEDDMLVAINGNPLVTQKQDSGVLVVEYGNYVLTYTPVVLEQQDAERARNRWNQAFGRSMVYGLAGYPIYMHHPIHDLDTVLLLPREIKFP